MNDYYYELWKKVCEENGALKQIIKNYQQRMGAMLESLEEGSRNGKTAQHTT